MKILFLNPKIDAMHQISIFLQQKGAALLFPADSKEAIQTLRVHGSSVDLAIVNLEGNEGPDSGIKLIKKIKQDVNQADLPIILTSGIWTEGDCAKHQNGPDGVNAYLRSPFSESRLLEVIEAVMGSPLSGTSGESGVTPPITAAKFSSRFSPKSSYADFPVLEDGSVVFLQEEMVRTKDSIVLEAPEGMDVPFNSTEAVSGEVLPELSPSLSVDPPPVLELEASAPSMGIVQLEIPTASSGGESYALPPADESYIEPQIENDQQVAQEMPYLFGGFQKQPSQPRAFDPALLFAEPLGDAVVPGGAAQTPDLETFKKYLLLREQDVGVLSTQLKAAHDQIKLSEQVNREETAKNAELTHIVNEQKHKIDDFEKEKGSIVESLQIELGELRFQIKAKTDKARVLESQAREISEEMEHLKDRVRIDIRKIRVREKELENRVEIMKKDSEALLGARETKIIELKRKLDLLEFNMDLLQDQYAREKENSAKLRERLARAAQVVRVAGGLLDSPKGAGSVELLPEEGAVDGISEEKEQKVS